MKKQKFVFATTFIINANLFQKGSIQKNVDKYLQCHPAKVEYLRDVLAIVESIRRSEAVRVLVTGSFLTVKLFQDACRLEQRKQ